MASRPIPISRDSSRRASPTSSTASHGRMDTSPVNGISQSCPVGHANVHALLSSSYQPPRAPIIGSLPEPSALDSNPMPELVLPPPARDQQRRPPTTSVVQVRASLFGSCPGDIGFMREGMAARSWAPSPRTADEFDLSKSPALAAMSAMRDGRPPTNTYRQTPASSSLSYSYTMASARRFFPEGHTEAHNGSLAPELLISTRDRTLEDNHRDLGLSYDAPYSRTAQDRRGSTGSVTGQMDNLDLGDSSGGVFHFEEQ
ncbi:TPA: hypothetical protein N0F65_004941 [Lagenidium giganteum]|uniref:Uncharacterized protein n=1 Tax=Lagenidium giganteum TaxID=4803 RepID=A0AAV2Z1A5_9STRA|nr:TPA: hypothetical protein N0F65_004941 [Lagenidium giganteum]